MIQFVLTTCDTEHKFSTATETYLFVMKNKMVHKKLEAHIEIKGQKHDLAAITKQPVNWMKNLKFLVSYESKQVQRRTATKPDHHLN